PTPGFVTVSVKVMSSPALTVSGAAVFSITTFGQFTVTVAPDSSEGAFDRLTTAVLSTTPQVSAVVGDEMWTAKDAPSAIVPKSQLRSPSAITHNSAPSPPSMAQSVPGVVGRVSATRTP